MFLGRLRAHDEIQHPKLDAAASADDLRRSAVVVYDFIIALGR
jgi:hypothetical protein